LLQYFAFLNSAFDPAQWFMPIVCNPRYWGDKDQKACGLRPARAKRSGDLFSNNEPGVLSHVCHPSYAGGADMRIVVQSSGHQHKTLFKE
jgi:hypothetical protein